jgi:hypothetical protein
MKQLTKRKPMTCVTDFWTRVDKFERMLVILTITFAAGILIAIYAQRRLLIGMDKPDGKTEIGYSIYMDGLAQRNGYDNDEFNLRE